jgi:hypothetical protein
MVRRSGVMPLATPEESRNSKGGNSGSGVYRIGPWAATKARSPGVRGSAEVSAFCLTNGKIATERNRPKRSTFGRKRRRILMQSTYLHIQAGLLFLLIRFPGFIYILYRKTASTTPWGPGKIKAKQLGDAAKVEFLPGEIDSFGMYVAFSKKSKCNALKARFAEGIRKEVAEGRVKPLLDAAQKRAEQ